MDIHRLKAELARERKHREALEIRVAALETIFETMEESKQAVIHRRIANGIRRDRIALQAVNIFPPNKDA